MRTVTKSFLRYLIKRPGLSVLQLLGIAFGVAAVIGMALSARSALASFSQAVEFLRGKSTHVMERPAGPMEEAVLTKLMGDPAVKHFSPVIDKKIKLAHGESVRLLGIDPFLDRYIRPELSSVPFDESNRQSPRQYLDFLLKDSAILMERGLAAELGLKPGDTVSTTKGDFQILGVFPNPSGEPIMLMDIAHAQSLFNLSGKVDRVDLILSDEAGFISRWKEGYRIQSHLQRKETLVAMLAAFRLNLEALSFLALFVGVFLIYNTTTFAVVSRRRDAGILRSLGAQNHEIVLAFLAEILIFGVLGGALGAVIGYLLAHFLINLLGSTISNLYFFLRPTEPAVVGLDHPCRSRHRHRGKPPRKFSSTSGTNSRRPCANLEWKNCESQKPDQDKQGCPHGLGHPYRQRHTSLHVLRECLCWLCRCLCLHPRF